MVSGAEFEAPCSRAKHLSIDFATRAYKASDGTLAVGGYVKGGNADIAIGLWKLNFVIRHTRLTIDTSTADSPSVLGVGREHPH